MPTFTEDFSDDTQYVSGSTTGLTNTEIAQDVLRLKYDSANSEYYNSGNAITMQNLNPVTGQISSVTFSPSGERLYWNEGIHSTGYTSATTFNSPWYEHHSSSGRHMHHEYDNVFTSGNITESKFYKATGRIYHGYNDYFDAISTSKWDFRYVPDEVKVHLNVVRDYSMDDPLVSSTGGTKYWHQENHLYANNAKHIKAEKSADRHGNASGALRWIDTDSVINTYQAEIHYGEGLWGDSPIRNMTGLRFWARKGESDDSNIGVSLRQTISGDTTTTTYRGGVTVTGHTWQQYEIALEGTDNGGDSFYLALIRQQDLKQLDLHIDDVEFKMSQREGIKLGLKFSWQREESNPYNYITETIRSNTPNSNGITGYWLYPYVRGGSDDGGDGTDIHSDWRRLSSTETFSAEIYPQLSFDYTTTDFEYYVFALGWAANTWVSGGYYVHFDDKHLEIHGVGPNQDTGITETNAVTNFEYVKARFSGDAQNDKMNFVNAKSWFDHQQNYKVWDDTTFNSSGIKFTERMRPTYGKISGGSHAMLFTKDGDTYYSNLNSNAAAKNFKLLDNVTYEKDGRGIGEDVESSTNKVLFVATKAPESGYLRDVFSGNNYNVYWLLEEGSGNAVSDHDAYPITQQTYTLKPTGSSATWSGGHMKDGYYSIHASGGSNRWYSSPNPGVVNSHTFCGAWVYLTDTGQVWSMAGMELTALSWTRLKMYWEVDNNTTVVLQSALDVPNMSGKWLYLSTSVEWYEYESGGNFYASGSYYLRHEDGVMKKDFNINGGSNNSPSRLFFGGDGTFLNGAGGKIEKPLITYYTWDAERHAKLMNTKYWSSMEIARFDSGDPSSTTSKTTHEFGIAERKPDGNFKVLENNSGYFIVGSTHAQKGHKPRLAHSTSFSGTYSWYNLVDTDGVWREILDDSIEIVNVDGDTHILAFVDVGTEQYKLRYWRFSDRSGKKITAKATTGVNPEFEMYYNSNDKKTYAAPVAVDTVSGLVNVKAAGFASVGTDTKNSSIHAIYYDGTDWVVQSGAISDIASDWLDCHVEGTRVYGVATAKGIHDEMYYRAGEAREIPNTPNPVFQLFEWEGSTKTGSLINSGSEFQNPYNGYDAMKAEADPAYATLIVPGKPLLYMENRHCWHFNDFNEASQTGDYTSLGATVVSHGTYEGRKAMRVAGGRNEGVTLKWSDIDGGKHNGQSKPYRLAFKIFVKKGNLKIKDTSSTNLPETEINTAHDWQYIYLHKTNVDALNGELQWNITSDDTEFYIDTVSVMARPDGWEHQQQTYLSEKPMLGVWTPTMMPIQELSTESYYRKSTIEYISLLHRQEYGGDYYYKTSDGKKLHVNNHAHKFAKDPTFTSMDLDEFNSSVYFTPKIKQADFDLQTEIEYQVSRNGRHFFDVTPYSTYTFDSTKENDTDADFTDGNTAEDTGHSFLRTRIIFLTGE